MTKQARINGKFAPGSSGNPNGRPRKETRTDAADPSPSKARREVRHDAFVNPYSGHGTSKDRRRYTTHKTVPINDLAAIDLRRGSWLAKIICEALDDDAFRRAYTVELKDKKQTDALRRRIRKLGINSKAKWAGQMERACGGAALFPILVGATGDLSEPLDLDNPRIQKVRSIQQLEPRELIPVEWYEDLESDEKFGRPKLYRMQPLSGGGGRIGIRGGVYIHESRLAIYPGEVITRQLLTGQRVGWGDSVFNSTHEVIEGYGLSWGSAETILQNFSQRVVKYKGLMKMLEAKNSEKLLADRLAAQDMAASVFNGLALDADDELVQVAMSIAGLSDLLIQQAQIVCAAAQMPATRLMGSPPKGFNATGEFDDKAWDDRVINRQDDHTDPIEWLITLELLSTDGPTGGDLPEDFGIDWRPLDNPNEKVDAETRYLTAQTDEKYYGMGAPAKDILESRFGGKAYSRETTIDLKAVEEQAKIDAENAAKLDAATKSALGQEDPNDPNVAPKNGKPAPAPSEVES